MPNINGCFYENYEMNFGENFRLSLLSLQLWNSTCIWLEELIFISSASQSLGLNLEGSLQDVNDTKIKVCREIA